MPAHAAVAARRSQQFADACALQLSPSGLQWTAVQRHHGEPCALVYVLSCLCTVVHRTVSACYMPCGGACANFVRCVGSATLAVLADGTAVAVATSAGCVAALVYAFLCVWLCVSPDVPHQGGHVHSC